MTLFCVVQKKKLIQQVLELSGALQIYAAKDTVYLSGSLHRFARNHFSRVL